MINIKEIRIGNLIQFNKDFDVKYHKVEIFTAVSINERTSEWFSPIPITPEILKKCGFNKSDKSELWGLLKFSETWDWFIMKDISINKPTDDTYLVQFGNAGIMPPCKYVHQLQNLYFALTGEEIQINLNGSN